MDRVKIRIDMKTGLYIDVVPPDISGDDIVEESCPSGYYLPKWNGESWEEGATQEYIDSLKSEPQEPSIEENNRADIDYLAVMIGVEL